MIMEHVPTYHYCEQGSDEWHKLRIGKISASEVKKLFVVPKNGDKWGRGALTYADKLVQDWLTGAPEHITVGAMEWGHTYEQEARSKHAEIVGFDINEVGFVDIAEGIGCSPDGLYALSLNGKRIGNVISEYKCPANKDVHTKYVKTIEEGAIPKTHIPQVFMNMWGTKADYGEFVSYDPRIGGFDGISIVRVDFDSKCMRDFATIEYFEERVYAFRDMVSEMKEQRKTEKGIIESKTNIDEDLVNLCKNINF